MAHRSSRADGVDVVRTQGRPASRPAIEATVTAEGLTPRVWANEGDVTYGRHVHEHHKVLFCVSGSIVFHTDTGEVSLRPGDRMELPAGVGHSATVGPDGVECVEAYRP
jgi:mannose-6-phosphate isomerase-like protein (cupin superfamily)